MRKQYLLYEALTETNYGKANYWIIRSKPWTLWTMLELCYRHEKAIVTKLYVKTE